MVWWLPYRLGTKLFLFDANLRFPLNLKCHNFVEDNQKTYIFPNQNFYQGPINNFKVIYRNPTIDRSHNYLNFFNYKYFLKLFSSLTFMGSR